MIRWIGLSPWEFEFPFSGGLTSTFPNAGGDGHVPRPCKAVLSADPTDLSAVLTVLSAVPTDLSAVLTVLSAVSTVFSAVLTVLSAGGDGHVPRPSRQAAQGLLQGRTQGPSSLLSLQVLEGP